MANLCSQVLIKGIFDIFPKFIYLEYLDISQNNENIHGDSHNNIEDPHDFSLKFWNVYLGSKNRNWIKSIWIINFI